MSQRKLISFDWALKRLLRGKANYEVLVQPRLNIDTPYVMRFPLVAM